MMTWFNAANADEAHEILGRLGRDVPHPQFSTRHLGQVQSPGNDDVTRTAVEPLWGDRYERLTEEQERVLVELHHAGNAFATEELLHRFMPVLKRLAVKYRKSGFVVGYRDDDIRQQAVLGFMEALDQTKPGELVRKYAARAVLHQLEEVGFWHRPVYVPKRTRQRFVAVMAEADSDPIIAAELAPEHGMSPEVFWMCFRAANFEDQYAAPSRHLPPLDGSGDDDPADVGEGKRETEFHDGGFDNVDEYMTIAAMAAGAGLDDRERAVVFGAYLGKKDAEVAAELGIDRTRVVHIRAVAFAKMREASGAVGEEN